ncbi:RNA-dependent RNA polymerase, partial [Hyaloscypha finlandica]
IPIPGSYNALGLTDDSGVLKEKEVYIRAQERTISGEVLVYRDPILHIGDIQTITAITDRQLIERLGNDERAVRLASMNNVIFFSQKDNPPFPHLLAGGDLDGDRFEILEYSKDWTHWLCCYRTPDGNNDYANEDVNSVPTNMNSFDFSEVAKFIGQYIRNDCFAELQDLHMWLADERPRGMNDPDVKALAYWLSQAVDYAKSGVKVDLYENVINAAGFSVGRAKPDFLRGVDRETPDDVKREYYPSSKVLGSIYRTISKVEYPIPDILDDTP